MSLLPALQAKNAPSWALICPNDVTVDCDAELWDLSIYGVPNTTTAQATTQLEHLLPTTTSTAAAVVILPEPGPSRIPTGTAILYPNHYRRWRWQFQRINHRLARHGYTLEGCNPNTHPDVTGKPTWCRRMCHYWIFLYRCFVHGNTRL